MADEQGITPVHECMHWPICKMRDDVLCPLECGYFEDWHFVDYDAALMILGKE